jgi:predicted DNA-binding WGR domain protein
MERYELVEGTSAKFWQFEVQGNDLVVVYSPMQKYEIDATALSRR